MPNSFIVHAYVSAVNLRLFLQHSGFYTGFYYSHARFSIPVPETTAGLVRFARFLWLRVLRTAFFRSSEFETLGHGKKIHCFSGKTLEAGRRFFFINSVGIPRKPQTGMLKCWSCSLVPGLPPQLSSLAVRITGRSVIRTAS